MRIGRRYRKHLKMMAALSMQVRFFNSCSDDVTLSQRPTPKKNLNHRDDLQRRPGRQQSLTKGGEPTQSEAHAELVELERQVERGIEIFLAKRPWSPTGTGTGPEKSDDRSVTILREAKTQPKIKRTRRIWRKILKDGVVDRLKKGPRIPKSHRRRQQGSSRRRRQQGTVPADRDQNKRQGLRQHLGHDNSQNAIIDADRLYSGSDLPKGAEGADHDDYELDDWERPSSETEPEDVDRNMQSQWHGDRDIRSPGRLTDMSDQEIQYFFKFDSKKHGVAGGNQGFDECLQFVVSQLDAVGMELSDVPKDGDCLLHAILRVLRDADSQRGSFSPGRAAVSVNQLRYNVVEFLRDSLTDDDVANFLLTLDHSAHSKSPNLGKDEYLRGLAKRGVYMGQTEVQALSDMFRVEIILISGKVFESMPGRIPAVSLARDHSG
jgi:hypothetical protein